MNPASFDPDDEQLDGLLASARELIIGSVDNRAGRPVRAPRTGEELVDELLADRPGDPVELDAAMTVIRDILATGTDNAAAGDLAYIPGSGLISSGIADLIAAATNRYTGLAGPNPAAVALEAGVLAWLTELFELPDGSQATLVSGGSIANMNALVAAREKHAPGAVQKATIYVGEHAHASVAKSARIVGVHPDHVRVCASLDGLRVDPEAVRVAVKDDVADGLIPMAVVAAAGTTNAGTVDPLVDLAGLCRDLGVWFHVDAAYGGFFQLTDRGRRRLRGIEQADSITLDPHKSLFLPFGTGALLVRDGDDLRRAFADHADYLRDMPSRAELPDFSDLTPELSREWRGLRLWLPLKLHGVEAFRAALDDKLDLAALAYRELDEASGVEVLHPPELSIVSFRVDGDDAAQDRALAEINRTGDVRLSSTVIGGQVMLRLAVLSHRTDEATVTTAVHRIRAVAGGQVQ